MLSSHTTKRRRRKKKPDLPRPTSQGGHPAGLGEAAQSANPPPPQASTSKCRVTAAFRREEQEVLHALRQRSETKRLAPNPATSLHDQQLEREIEFFEAAIPPAAVADDWQDAIGATDADDDDDIVPAGRRRDGGAVADDLADDRTAASTEPPDDGLQLASSFVQIEDDPVVRPWTPKLWLASEDDDDLFFDCNDEPPELLPEDGGSLQSVRNVEQDGLFVPPRPQGLASQTEQFMIRRFLATGNRELVQTTNGRPHLAGAGSSAGPRPQFPRRFPAKQFQPIFFDAELEYHRGRLPDTGLATKPASLARSLKLFVASAQFDQIDASNEEAALTEDIYSLHALHMERQHANHGDQLERKLAAIRKILRTYDAAEAGARQRQTEQYRMERRDLRNQLHRERQTDRNMVRSILEKWKRLKDVRQAQGFMWTSLKLVIRTQECNEEADARRWDHDFNVELNEVLEEAIGFYENEMREYAVDVKLNPSAVAPIRPNPDDLQDMLQAVFSKSRRHPGEPLVQLELGKMSVGDNAKQMAQNMVKRFTLQVIVGKRRESKVVAAKCIGRRAYLNEEFELRSLPVTESGCKLVLFEEKTRNQATAIELIVPLPGSHELYSDAVYVQMGFTTKAGSSGQISLKIGWSEDKSCAQLHCGSKPAVNSKAPEPEVNKSVKTWYDALQVDPMNPDATSLCKLADPNQTVQGDKNRPADKDTDDSHGLFRLNEDLTAFCSWETIAQDQRITALIARYQDQLRLQHEQIIPPISREIEDPPVADGDRRFIEDLSWMDPIDMQRHHGRKYLAGLYRTISAHCERLRQHSASQNLLIGNDVPTFGSFFATIRQLFRTPGAPLNPQRQLQLERSAAFGSVGSAQYGSRKSMESRAKRSDRHHQYRLVINVLRAHGVPCRVGGEQRDIAGALQQSRKISTVSSVMSHRQPATVQSYAVVSVRDRSIRTNTAEGCNPTWNEQMIVALSDAGSADLSREMVCVQLFDEVVEDLLDEDRMRANEIYQRISGRWLGELRIPVYTIFAEQRIEGTFEMTTPQIILGYTKPTLSPSTHLALPLQVPQVRNNILITLLIHVEPHIEMPRLGPSLLQCSESTTIESRVALWLEEFREQFPHRPFDPLVALSSGKRVCITRLIGELPLPFERSDGCEFLVRRFVALIPLVRSEDACARLDGVWLVNDQILSLLTASAKDLGILLACYYLALGHRGAAVVFGRALPYGDAAFVLIKENGEHQLVDPCTGRKYAATDTHCPLRFAYAIAGPGNVWANQQRETRVFQTRFNTANAADWRPLFTRRNAPPPPEQIVHSPQLQYAASGDCTDLRRLIEWKLQRKFSAWRAHRRTTWNRGLNDLLLGILVDLEEDVCYEYETRDYAGKLQHLHGLYAVSGHPVQMAYSSLSAVVERVRATGVHLSVDAQVEFALTVHVQPYPGNVLSVWVFVLALVPRN